MRFVFISFIHLLVLWLVSGLDIEHLQLNDAKYCNSSGLCDNQTSPSHQFPRRNCMCDKNCEKYGDCCLDSPYHKDDQRRAMNSFVCQKVFDFANHIKYIYMRTECPPSWASGSIANNCKKSAVGDTSDPFLITPVTSYDTNITYGNAYCSVCNNDTRIQYWILNMKGCNNCITTSAADILKNLSFDQIEKRWQMLVNGQYRKFDIVSSYPQELQDNVRQCVPIIKTCPATWNKDSNNIRDKCESYTLIVHTNSTPPVSYRNAHCAICNSVPIQNVHCVSQSEKSEVDLRMNSAEYFLSLSELLNFGNIKKICRQHNCEDDSFVYDLFSRTCRNPKTNEKYPVSPENESINSTNCSNRLFHQSDVTYERKSPTYQGIITIIGIGISIFCLLLHLIVSVIVKHFHNLSGKNLASFCLALLLAYCGFVLGSLNQRRWCFLIAVATYYFFLVAFAWMLIMSFDVWRTLRIASKELRVSTGQQWRKFFIYSFCGWILPAKIVLVALIIDNCPMGISDSFKPNFGYYGRCWFGQGLSALVFFGIPILIVLVFNLIFFLSSTYMIYSSQSMTRYSASPGTKRDYRLYIRLALLMGLTWVTGLMAQIIDNEIVWVIFILSNTLLGLFIFIAFTCRTKILHALKSLNESSLRNLPACSWWMNVSESGDSNSKFQTDKPTSTTYY